jgi:hypothetical protein
MSPGESLGLDLDRCDDDGGLDIGTTLLGASCFETRRGGSRWPSSSTHRSPRMFFRGAMHAIVGETKTMSS